MTDTPALQQIVKIPLGEVQLTITTITADSQESQQVTEQATQQTAQQATQQIPQKEKPQQQYQLQAVATYNNNVVLQLCSDIAAEQPTKNELMGLKKQAVDDIKRDEHVIRRIKLQTIRQQQTVAFPNQVQRTHLIEQLNQQSSTIPLSPPSSDTNSPEINSSETNSSASDALAQGEKEHYCIVGRMMGQRIMGKAAFAHIQDVSGSIQLYISQNDLPEGGYKAFKQWDIGDILQAKGFLFHTQKGELTLHVTEIQLISKSLRPLPDKYHGLKDTETRYRQRYLDLIINQDTRETFIIRSKLIHGIRHFFEQRQFLEVETPMMHPIPGGAIARPFVTHHNELDQSLYLRIAPELYLKRLIVGGFERVFEVNRNFRNEGVSTRHNPEFTMLEFYQAYADYHDLMDLTEQLMQQLCQTIKGSSQIEYQAMTIDFSQPFQRLSMTQAVLQYNPQLTIEDCQSLNSLSQYAKKLQIKISKNWGLGKLLTEVFEETVEEKLQQPTFITEYPTEVSPLARKNDDNPEITDRFEFFIAGREIANGFSELNDPEDQAERFKAQVAERKTGDDEAMHYDVDYINALEYAMPPTAGEGIGIDRLAMLFTNSPSIRDVILFPQLRTNH